MLETYLTVKTIILLFGLAFLLVYFVLCGIGLFNAVAEYHEMRKMIREIEREEHPQK